MTTRASTSLAASLANRALAERRRYRKRLERCQRKFSESAVHDLRVQTRRLLALLDLLGALHSLGSLKKIRKVFKQRLDAFDELRDTHVQLSLLSKLDPRFPKPRDLDALLSRRERRLTDELRQGVLATQQARLERRLKTVERKLRETAGQIPREEARLAIRTVLREAYDRVVTLRRRIRPNRAATVHRTRVAFKRFRYMSELLRPYLPGLRAADLERMREYQTMMGNLQDMEVFLAGLRRAVADQEISGRAVGPLRRELQRRRRELMATCLAAADRLFEFESSVFAAAASQPPNIES